MHQWLLIVWNTLCTLFFSMGLSSGRRETFIHTAHRSVHWKTCVKTEKMLSTIDLYHLFHKKDKALDQKTSVTEKKIVLSSFLILGPSWPGTEVAGSQVGPRWSRARLAWGRVDLVLYSCHCYLERTFLPLWSDNMVKSALCMKLGLNARAHLLKLFSHHAKIISNS